MAPSVPPAQTPTTDAAPPPPPLISPPNTVVHQSLITGCKVFATRPEESDARRAEVLGIRPRVVRKSRFARSRTGEGGEEAMDVDGPEEDKLEFYLHYVGFNKRLDEWVLGSRLLMSREVEWPQPPTASSSGAGPTSSTHGTSTPNKMTKAATSGTATPTTGASTPSNRKGGDLQLRKAALKAAATRTIGVVPPSTRKKSARRGGTETPVSTTDGSVVDDGDDEDGTGSDGAAVVTVEIVDDADADADGDSDIGLDALVPGQEKLGDGHAFSKEQEIEKLRTSGSMTQSHHEISRVKNLDRIQIGRHEVEAWYFSPYPVEFAHVPTLFVCAFCLSFFGSEKQLERHRRRCDLTHPPGNEIYRHEDVHFFEVDGRRQKTWCRNLCLLSKCFLDHKTLYYDVDPFLFYVMCRREDDGLHLVGYFSKEKESAENYNLACILTLPQYQRHGYGKLLIEFSYELSKKEGKLGSPEKPLSDLGLLSYRAYWEETIVELVLEQARVGDDVSIDEIANRTAITHADIFHVCQHLQMLKFSQGGHLIVISDAIIGRHERAKAKKRRRIDPNGLKWQPHVFSRRELAGYAY